MQEDAMSPFPRLKNHASLEFSAPRRPLLVGRARQFSRGFTLVEMSMVLVIIAVIVGAVTVGNDVLRHAHGQRAFSELIMGWSNAFSRYVASTGGVPGDFAIPRNQVNGALNTPLCNNTGDSALSNAFLRKSVAPPSGRAAGDEDRLMYQDSNGSPHELRVCFVTVSWSVPKTGLGAAVGVYVTVNRHVMHITGLTSELALQLDTLIDGRLDARFGRFRRKDLSANTGAAGVDWDPVKLNNGEANIGEVEAYLEVN
jgi:prepilin-type N-terminal cleavage/methylation domain-containing protein